MSDYFSVCQWFPDGSYEYVRRYVEMEEALKAFRHYTSNPASRIGITQRVIITDGGDCIIAEWLRVESIRDKFKDIGNQVASIKSMNSKRIAIFQKAWAEACNLQDMLAWAYVEMEDHLSKGDLRNAKAVQQLMANRYGEMAGWMKIMEGVLRRK
jgi:hypothetical protein